MKRPKIEDYRWGRIVDYNKFHSAWEQWAEEADQEIHACRQACKELKGFIRKMNMEGNLYAGYIDKWEALK